MSRLKFERTEMWLPTRSDALREAERLVQIRREEDTKSWQEVSDLAKAFAAECGFDWKEWENEPAAYWATCTKCHAQAVLFKGSPREFGVYGIYVCGTCEYAYPPGCQP